MLRKHLPYLSLFLFSLSYIFFYPTLLLITDEQSYFNLALSVLQGTSGVLDHPENIPTYSTNLVEGKYTIGTSLLLIPFIKLFGHCSVFLVSLVCFTISYILTLITIRSMEYRDYGILLFLIYIPLLFLCRTIMSEMPSLLLVSVSLFILFRKSVSVSYWPIFFFSGISILFRETNVLIFFPILLTLFIKSDISANIKNGLAFIVGTSLRGIAHALVYGNAFHLKKGFAFSYSFITDNIALYTMILFVLIPMGLVWMFLYRGPYYKTVIGAVLIFTVFHLCYGYNGMDYSGIKMGSILNGRFFIPLIPLFAIAISYSITKLQFSKSKVLYGFAFGVSTIIAVGSQYYIYNITKDHTEVASQISNLYQDELLIFDHSLHTNIRRYINPFLGNQKTTLDISRISDKGGIQNILAKKNKAYLIISERTGSSDKLERNQDINLHLSQYQSSFELSIDNVLTTKDGGKITVYKVSKNI